MRIHLENTPNTIRELVASIEQNPASFEDCKYIHIAAMRDVPQRLYAALLRALREAHSDLDCEAFLCPDNDVFILGRDLGEAQLAALASELMSAISLHDQTLPGTHMYDLSTNRKEACQSLLNHSVQHMPEFRMRPRLDLAGMAS